MQIITHKRFDKQFEKLTVAQKAKFGKQVKLFLSRPLAPALNNHPLTGEYKGYRSFNVGGDIRVVFEMLDDTVAVFHYIGTHSELYS